MMPTIPHEAPQYALGLASPQLPSKLFFRTRALSALEAQNLKEALYRDSAHYRYNSLVSLTSAITALDRGDYTWAIVKLYYSVFYSLRAVLGDNGVCIFYFSEGQSKKRSQFFIKASVGAQADATTEPSSHKAVISRVQKHGIVTFARNQDVDGVPPFDWLMTQREWANYRSACFLDPGLPSVFRFVKRDGVDKLLLTYAGDSKHLYTFDPEHAMLALPFHTLWFACRTAQSDRFPQDLDRQQLLADRTKYQKRKLLPLSNLI